MVLPYRTYHRASGVWLLALALAPTQTTHIQRMAPVWTVEGGDLYSGSVYAMDGSIGHCCSSSLATVHVQYVELSLSIMARDAACNALDHIPCGHAACMHGPDTATVMTIDDERRRGVASMRDHNQPYLAVVAGVKTKHRLSFCPGWGWRGRGRPLEGTHALHCTGGKDVNGR